MARLNIVGYETGSITEALGIFGGASIQSVVTRTGTYALQCTNAGPGSFAFVTMGAPGPFGSEAVFTTTNLYSRFYFQPAALPLSEQVFHEVVASGGALKFRLTLNPTGTISAYDSALTLLGTSTQTITAAAWNFIQVYTGTGVAGNYEIRLGGVTILSGIANLTAFTNSFIRLGRAANLTPEVVTFYYDDISLDDAEFPGPARILLSRPIADGAFTAWTGDWTTIGNIPPSGAIFNSTAVSNAAESVDIQTALTIGLSDQVRCVKPFNITRRSVGGPASVISRTVYNGFSYNTSAFIFVATSYDMFAQVWDRIPGTTQPWVISAFNAIEPGVVRGLGGTATLECTTLAAMVEDEGLDPQELDQLTLVGVS